jgi:transposase
VNDLIRIGIDTSKSVFVLHGVNAAEQPVLRRKLRRRQLKECLAKLPPLRIGIEACGAAHYWGRELTALGHEVCLLAPQHVKPYVRRTRTMRPMPRQSARR